MASNKFSKQTTPLGFVSVTPMPSDAELSTFYADVYYQQQATTTYQAEYSEEELADTRLRADLLVHAVRKFQKLAKSASWLDVGCGEGFVLAAAANAGFSVEGLEFSEFAVKKFHPAFADCVEIGNAFDLLERRIANGRTVDVCSLQNVVEHVREPMKLLAQVRKLIGRDGVGVMTVPNDYSRTQAKAVELGFVKDEYWFAPPQHLHYFNVDNLPSTLAEVGLDILDAYADFPIELFLFHPGSNYALDPKLGKAAHNARTTLDLMLAERGMEPYHRFCQAMTACGFGRNVTVVFRSGSA
jgi:SAM-dependent methyltransferase